MDETDEMDVARNTKQYQEIQCNTAWILEFGTWDLGLGIWDLEFI